MEKVKPNLDGRVEKVSGEEVRRQKSDISERRSKEPPLQPLVSLQHGRWVTVRPVRGHLTPKMNRVCGGKMTHLSFEWL